MNALECIDVKIKELEQRTKEKDEICIELLNKMEKERLLSYEDEGRYFSLSYQIHGIVCALSVLSELKEMILKEQAKSSGGGFDE